ncbi:MAG: hypothetical protein LUD25_00345 [Coriobacteriaceae bacterium]|nr:hypothetical protein [Coriobacteriaceae bacterium]
MANYGVIDLGSNSIRLVIFEVQDDSLPAYSRKDLTPIIDEKVSAGLAAHVDDGVFMPSGIKKAVSVLKRHVRSARYLDCVRCDIFATAAVRNCSNTDEVLDAIETEVGKRPIVLSEDEEAHLGFVGASCAHHIHNATTLDIGGGSAELNSIKDGVEMERVSIKQGALSSYSELVADILPTHKEAKAIEEAFLERLEGLPLPRHTFDSKHFVGMGGSIRACARIHAEVHDLPSHPKKLHLDDFHELLGLLKDDRENLSHAICETAPERIHTVMPGCAIAYATMKHYGAQTIEICHEGVREGYLIERMLGSRACTPSQKDE